MDESVRPLPMTPEEVQSRGWTKVDVVFVTGDAYVDHPSFAMALLGRLLESEGFRVAILSQPDWYSCEPWRQFGRPRVCFCISAGNMDSMINHYTANRKVRNEDAYSPDGQIGLRPDRATLVYCQRAREAFPDVPIIAGGVEASLRRLAHYDYWSDKVRRSIILDAKADLLVYGMGERALVEIVRRLAAGSKPKELRDVRGVVYWLGAREPLPEARYSPGIDLTQAGKGETGKAETQRQSSGEFRTDAPPPGQKDAEASRLLSTAADDGNTRLQHALCDRSESGCRHYAADGRNDNLEDRSNHGFGDGHSNFCGCGGSTPSKGTRPTLSEHGSGGSLENTESNRADTSGRISAEARQPAADTVFLPTFDEVVSDRRAFAEMTRLAHLELNPFCGRRLVQYHGAEAVVINPPPFPLSEAEMDRIYDLPFTRRPHPSYGKRRIPAFDVVATSVQVLRGCFGGCAFCSLAAHQGRIVQSRSLHSVIAEVQQIASDPKSRGVISDLGGPTANMYQLGCKRPEIQQRCRRQSCLYPNICKLLETDARALIELLQAARKVPGVRRVFVASGIRMDLALKCRQYIEEIAKYHVGGLLKVAPEHSHPQVLARMRKPTIEVFEKFASEFKKASKKAGKEQYLLPYMMAGHPGSTLETMIDVALYLKKTGCRPDQVQDFIPAPFDLATCMYYTGIDPMTGEEVYVPRSGRERRLQRALLQFWKPENYHLVREALVRAGRTDLIGNGPGCLIGIHPPRSATGRQKSGKIRPVSRNNQPGTKKQKGTSGH